MTLEKREIDKKYKIKTLDGFIIGKFISYHYYRCTFEYFVNGFWYWLRLPKWDLKDVTEID